MVKLVPNLRSSENTPDPTKVMHDRREISSFALTKVHNTTKSHHWKKSSPNTESENDVGLLIFSKHVSLLYFDQNASKFSTYTQAVPENSKARKTTRFYF